MKNFDREEFGRLKNDVALEYKKIISVYNPALKSEIFFNASGWHHLRYDGNRSERSKLAQKNKFIFFLEAVNVIKISTTIQEYRRNTKPIEPADSYNGRQMFIIEWFAFWAINSFTKQTRIKVIVRRLGGANGKYHFWSLMPFWSLQHGQRDVGSGNLENE
jgi:hypothetical protein